MHTKFIQHIQHDLRTQVFGISQMTEILLKKRQNSEQKVILKKIADSSERLLKLVNDISNFDRSVGQAPVLLKKINLHDLVSDVIDTATPLAQLKNLKLIFICSTGVPEILVGDEARVFRILLNLVSNAVKFTRVGSVKITLQIAKWIDAKNLLLKIIVKDTGIGISKNRLPQFGSGLGLSITKQFIDELHGEIKVKSTVGQGTAFICLLPFKIALKKNEKRTVGSTTQSNQPRILLVEDDELAQIAARDIFLNQLHTNFTLAATGRDVLKLLKTNGYDLIFMDVELPDMSGYDLVRKIRETNKTLQIIALTAHNSLAVKTQCKNATMNDFLKKPLNITKVRRMLKKKF